MILIYLQLLVLGAICLGWMYWLNQCMADGTWSWRRSCLLFGVGFAAQILLLQNLTYLGFPIKFTFPLPALIGIAGLWKLYEIWRGPAQLEASFRINCRYGAAIFLAVFSLQSVSGILEGPGNYYGKAHIDHFNYTSMSEFVKSESFTVPDAEMQKQAWLVKAFQYKNIRIGQSVAQAYLASLSFVSAKDSYAGLCSFLVALLALATFVLAQSFSLSRPYCALAAIWVGLAPATTKIHLDGFLSQACILFVLPLIIIWARLTGESIRFKAATGAVLLSYLLVCYTEFFILGVFLLAMLTLSLVILWSRRQLWISTAVVGISLLLVPAYLPRAYNFAAVQYAVASNRSPVLEALAPNGGTVYGWASSLIEIPLTSPPLARQATTAVGVFLLGLCLFGSFSRSRRNQLFLVAATLTPVVFLGILLYAPVLSKYPFMKISDSFIFLWVLLVMRGISLIAVMVLRQWGALAPSLLRVLPGGLILLCFVGFFSEHKLIANQGNGALSLLNKKEYKDALKYVATHPERTYVIRYPDGLAAGWLAYEGRYSKVYVLSSPISDLPIAPGSLPFTVMPDGLDPNGITSINMSGYHDVTANGGVPDMQIMNPQGQDGNNSEIWYWLGDTMNMEFFRWTGEGSREYMLSFRAEAGPAHPSPTRTISLTNLRNNETKVLRFLGSTLLTVPIVLVQGKNLFRIDSVEPIEHVNRIPNDLRKHMSRLSSFTLGPPKPISDSDPQVSNQKLSDSQPLLAPKNPQGEDQAGGRSWYWIGRQMELELIRTDSKSTNVLYELTFDAEAGPANSDPKRKIRVRNTSDNRATDFSFTGTGKPVITFTARPGSTRLIIEVLSPTEQKTHVPNDQRNLMVRVEHFSVKPVPEKIAPGRPAKKAAEQVPALVGR